MTLLITVADLRATFYRVYDRPHALFHAVFDGETVLSGGFGIRDLLQPENLVSYKR